MRCSSLALAAPWRHHSMHLVLLRSTPLLLALDAPPTAAAHLVEGEVLVVVVVVVVVVAGAAVVVAASTLV